MNAGKAIKYLLIDNDMSNKTAAEKMGVSQQTVSQMKKTKKLREQTMSRVCKLFGLTAREFMEMAEDLE